MANTTISPNMGMPVPVVNVDPGVDWANNVNACLSILDSHTHTVGQGVLITPSAININSDLTMSGNNLTSVRTVRFLPQVSAPADPADLGCLVEIGVDLYYIDGSGNLVRITQSGSVTGSAGTITGLPSGTASASFAAGKFTFQSATSTAATMDFGPIIIRNTTASSNGVTVSPPVSLPSNYSLFLPALPATGRQALYLDTSGNVVVASGITAVGMVPIGAIIPTLPSVSGSYTTAATTAGDNNTGYALCVGQTVTDARSPLNGSVVPDLTGDIFLMGSTVSGSTGGNNSINFAHAHSYAYAHTHQWAHLVASAANAATLGVLFSPASGSGAFSPGTNLMGNLSSGSGSDVAIKWALSGAMTTDLFTSGALDNSLNLNPSQNTGSALSTTDMRPNYISVVYLIRLF